MFEESFSGNDAVLKIQQFLTDHPLCQKLAEEVGGFFGDEFMIILSFDRRYSLFCPYTGIPRDMVYVRLAMNTHREVPALVHELLHAKLLTEHFPWLEMTDRENITQSHVEMFNVVHHEIIYSQFVSLGMNPDDFVTPSFLDAWTIDQLSKDDTDVSAWYREWYMHWQIARLTQNPTCVQDTQKVVELGKQRYSSFEKTLSQVEGWVERSDYRNAAMFEQSFNELMSLMEMTSIPFTKWFRLEHAEPKILIHRNADSSKSLIEQSPLSPFVLPQN